MCDLHENPDVPGKFDQAKKSGTGCFVVIVVLITVIGAGIWYAVYMAQQVRVIVNDAYAVEWTATFIIEHMKTNGNQWPAGWEDVKDEYDRLNSPNSYPCPWGELQKRVIVDWDANPVELAKGDLRKDPPFEVIRIVDGSKHAWEGSEPNRMILEYLLESSKQQAEHEPPARP